MTFRDHSIQRSYFRRRAPGLLFLTALVVILVGLLVRPAAIPAAGNAFVESAYPFVTGQVQNFLLESDLKLAPEIAFVDDEGTSMRLDDFNGQWVLLNLWATWCGPCRREMPSLNRLQAELGGEGLLILPLSQDRTGIEDVKRFYEDLDLDYLALYLDDTAESQFQFSVTGLPVTMLVNPNGRVVGRMLGAVEWDAPEALALFRYFLAEPQR